MVMEKGVRDETFDQLQSSEVGGYQLWRSKTEISLKQGDGV